MKYYYSYRTRIGELWFQADETGITRISFSRGEEKDVKQETAIIKQAYSQIEEYFQGKRTSFDLLLNLEGTPFQRKVWEVLKTIPYGEVWSYKQVATAIGNPLASRAVGMANNRNPIPILVPCHRVIGTNGKLVGYAGGLGVKEQLLNLEKQYAKCLR